MYLKIEPSRRRRRSLRGLGSLGDSSAVASLPSTVSGPPNQDALWNSLPKVLEGLRTAPFDLKKYLNADGTPSFGYFWESGFTWEFDSEDQPVLVGLNAAGQPMSASWYWRLNGSRGVGGLNLSEGGGQDPTIWDFVWIGVDGFVPNVMITQGYTGRTYAKDGFKIEVNTGKMFTGAATALRLSDWAAIPDLKDVVLTPAGFAKGYRIDDASNTRDGESPYIIGPDSTWSSHPGGRARVLTRLMNAWSSNKYTRIVVAVDCAAVIIGANERGKLASMGDSSVTGLASQALSTTMTAIAKGCKWLYEYSTQGIFDQTAGWLDSIPLVGKTLGDMDRGTGGLTRLAIADVNKAVKTTESLAQDMGVPPEVVAAVAVVVAGTMLCADPALIGVAGFISVRQGGAGIMRQIGLPPAYVNAFTKICDTSLRVGLDIMTSGTAEAADQLQTQLGAAAEKQLSATVNQIIAEAKTKYGDAYLKQFIEKTEEDLRAKLGVFVKMMGDAGRATLDRNMRLVWPSMGPNKLLAHCHDLVKSSGLTYAEAYKTINDSRSAALGIQSGALQGLSWPPTMSEAAASSPQIAALQAQAQAQDTNIARARVRVQAIPGAPLSGFGRLGLGLNVGGPALTLASQLPALTAATVAVPTGTTAQIEAAEDLRLAIESGDFTAFNKKWNPPLVAYFPPTPKPYLKLTPALAAKSQSTIAAFQAAVTTMSPHLQFAPWTQDSAAQSSNSGVLLLAAAAAAALLLF